MNSLIEHLESRVKAIQKVVDEAIGIFGKSDLSPTEIEIGLKQMLRTFLKAKEETEKEFGIKQIADKNLDKSKVN